MQAITALRASARRRRRGRIGVSANVTVDLLGTVPAPRRAARRPRRAEVVPGDFDDPHRRRPSGSPAAGSSTWSAAPLLRQPAAGLRGAAGRTSTPAVVDAKRGEAARRETRLVLEQARAINRSSVGRFHRFARPASAPAQRPDRRRDGRAVQRHASRGRAPASSPTSALVDTAAVVRRGSARERPTTPASTSAPRRPTRRASVDALARRILLADARLRHATSTRRSRSTATTRCGAASSARTCSRASSSIPIDYPGNVFWRVQQRAAPRSRSSGVLLCLCTKNNPADVDEVLRSHPDMVLQGRAPDRRTQGQLGRQGRQPAGDRRRAQHRPRQPWSSSTTRRSRPRRSATRLPMVRWSRCPARSVDYPALVEDVARAVPRRRRDGGQPLDKTEQYRQRAATAGEASDRDARGVPRLARPDGRAAPRLAGRDRPDRELSLKSNQFNLTTRRYTEAEVARADGGSGDAEVFTLTVSDSSAMPASPASRSFATRARVARIENLPDELPRPRPRRRVSPWGRDRRRAAARGCRRIEAAYLPTAKNAQVADFYDRLGLEPRRAARTRRPLTRVARRVLDPPVPPG